MSETGDVKSKKLTKMPSIKEISFSVDEAESPRPSPRREKLVKKNRAKSVTNLKEHFRSRSVIDSSRNLSMKSSPRNDEVPEKPDPKSEGVQKPQSYKMRREDSSISVQTFAIPSSSSEKKKTRRLTSSKKIKVKTPRKATTSNNDTLESIVYSSKKYWAEGFTESPPDENADDLFLVDDHESAELFSIQDFNVHNVYEKIFMNVPHANFIGLDEKYGPVLISITRESVDDEGQTLVPNRLGKKQSSELNLQSTKSTQSSPNHSLSRFADDSVPKSPPTQSPRQTDGLRRAITGLFLKNTPETIPPPQGYHHYVLIRYKAGDKILKIPSVKSKSHKNSKSLLAGLINICPPIDIDWVNTEFKETTISYEAIKSVEDKLLMDKYKFGVIYAKQDQSNDNEMLQNTEASEDFDRFMRLISRKIPLKGWSHYSGGLDVANDSTGQYSYYTKFRGFEIMFHVSTLLPHLEGDEQQVEKKRHIGNDVVVIVFLEGNAPFDPDSIKSVFNHVFIVVQRVNPTQTRSAETSTESKPSLNDEEEPITITEHLRANSNNSDNSSLDTSTSEEKTSPKDSIEKSRSDTQSDDENERSFLHLRQDSNEDSSSNNDDIPRNRRLSQSYRAGKLQLKKGKPQRFSRNMTELQKARLNLSAKQRAMNPPPKYRIEIVSKRGVAESTPMLPDPPIFSNGPYLKEFLLTKLINCERAAYLSPHFSKPMERTRELLLRDLYTQSSKL